MLRHMSQSTLARAACTPKVSASSSGHGDREDPPRRNLRRRDERGHADRDDDAGGDEPVIADEELPDELASARNRLMPQQPPRSRLRRGGLSLQRPRQRAQKIPAMTASSAASPPGQCAPALRRPRTSRTTSASRDRELHRVLRHARERRMDRNAGDHDECDGDTGGGRREPNAVLVGAKVRTMKITSRPSRKTPLKEIVNEWGRSARRAFRPPAPRIARARRSRAHREAPCARTRAGSPCAAIAGQTRAAARRRRRAARRAARCQRGPERCGDAAEEDDGGADADEGRAPAARYPDREHDCERLDCLHCAGEEDGERPGRRRSRSWR